MREMNKFLSQSGIYDKKCAEYFYSKLEQVTEQSNYFVRPKKEAFYRCLRQIDPLPVKNTESISGIHIGEFVHQIPNTKTSITRK